jgi:uncharacterized membrane protein YccF (DUF307 family)
MRFVGNVIWLVLAGFWLSVAYVIAGVIACILIITIPFGVASFRMAGYALWPFGRTVIPAADKGVGSTIGNVVWFIVAGWWLALAHIVSAVALAITIIGLPFAVADLKMVALAVAPFGKRVVDIDDLAVIPDGALAPPRQVG